MPRLGTIVESGLTMTRGAPLPIQTQHRVRVRRGAACLLAAGVAVATVAVVASPAVAAPACTDSWTNTAGGQWDTGSSWSKGAAPTSTDVACITAAGTYTVVVGNETITVAGLTVGGAGSTPTLQMGNAGAGLLSFTSNGTVTNAATISTGWEGSFTAPEVDNSGTFTIPASSYTSPMTVTKFVNSGTFSVLAPVTYSMPTSASVFTNTGTVSVATGQSLAYTSPSGQTGSFIQAGLITDKGTMTIADATEISGGSICAGTPLIGAGDGGTGGTLSFDTTVAAGPSCGSGVLTDSIFVPNVTATISGTIPAAYTVSIGDGGSSLPHVTLSGVTNSGHLSFGWGGTLTGPLTNTGTFSVPTSAYTSTWSSTRITNSGTFASNANLSITFANGSTFSNSAASTVSTPVGVTLTVQSASGDTATVVSAGTVTNLGAVLIADALQINGGSICGNAVVTGLGDGGTGGSVAFAAKPAKGAACAKKQPKDQIFIPNVTSTIGSNIPKGWTVTIGDGGANYAHVTMTGTTNSGSLVVGYGATLTDASTLVNAGTLTVPHSAYTTMFALPGLTNNGKVSLLGPANVNLGGGTFATAAKKSVTVGVATPVVVTGALTNAGTLTVDAGGTVSATAFTQSGTGTFVAQDGATSEPTYLTTSGASTLAGTVSVTAAKKFKPAAGAMLTLVSAQSVTGTFATVKGTFTVAYSPTTVKATNS